MSVDVTVGLRSPRWLPPALRVWTARTLVVVTFFALWEVSSRLGYLSIHSFSRPSAIWSVLTAWATDSAFYENLGITLRTILFGGAAGISLGIVLGVVMATVPVLADIVDPYMVILNAMPRILLMPIFILLFGLGAWSKIVLVITMVLFPVYFNVYNGVRAIDPDIVANVRLLGAGRWELVRHVYAPSAIGWFFASMRVAVGFALLGAIVGEYMGSLKGLGHLIMVAAATLQTDRVMAGLVCVLLMAGVLDLITRTAESLMTPWRRAESREGV